MHILVALDNYDIKKKIDDKYKDYVYSYDITIKEDVIDYLKKEKKPYTIVTKLGLKGNITDTEYIENMRQTNKKNKIVIITNFLSTNDKKMLFSNEVFNIIVGNEIDIDSIYNQIETKDKIIYKTLYKKDLNNKNARKIAVFGTSGAGKSFISYLLSKSIASHTDSNVNLISLDYLNPCVDVLLNNPSIKYDINLFTQQVNKDVIEKYITFDKSFKNLSYITPYINNGMFKGKKVAINSCLNIDIKKLINNLSQSYEFIILDMPSNTLYTELKDVLNLVDDVIFVLNPNYICLKQAKKNIQDIQDDIPNLNQKVTIISNKNSGYSLDISQIKSILKTKSNIITVKYYPMMEGYINGILSNSNFLTKDEIGILKILKIKINKGSNKLNIIERWNKYGQFDKFR